MSKTNKNKKYAYLSMPGVLILIFKSFNLSAILLCALTMSPYANYEWKKLKTWVSAYPLNQLCAFFTIISKESGIILACL